MPLRMPWPQLHLRILFLLGLQHLALAPLLCSVVLHSIAERSSEKMARMYNPAYHHLLQNSRNINIIAVTWSSTCEFSPTLLPFPEMSKTFVTGLHEAPSRTSPGPSLRQVQPPNAPPCFWSQSTSRKSGTIRKVTKVLQESPGFKANRLQWFEARSKRGRSRNSDKEVQKMRSGKCPKKRPLQIATRKKIATSRKTIEKIQRYEYQTHPATFSENTFAR